jgi:hypothetical protein
MLGARWLCIALWAYIAPALAQMVDSRWFDVAEGKSTLAVVIPEHTSSRLWLAGDLATFSSEELATDGPAVVQFHLAPGTYTVYVDTLKKGLELNAAGGDVNLLTLPTVGAEAKIEGLTDLSPATADAVQAAFETGEFEEARPLALGGTTLYLTREPPSIRPHPTPDPGDPD